MPATADRTQDPVPRLHPTVPNVAATRAKLRSFGVQVRSNIPVANRPDTSRVQRGLLKPSTGGTPGWATRPCPWARLRA